MDDNYIHSENGGGGIKIQLLFVPNISMNIRFQSAFTIACGLCTQCICIPKCCGDLWYAQENICLCGWRKLWITNKFIYETRRRLAQKLEWWEDLSRPTGGSCVWPTRVPTIQIYCPESVHRMGLVTCRRSIARHTPINTPAATPPQAHRLHRSGTMRTGKTVRSTTRVLHRNWEWPHTNLDAQRQCQRQNLHEILAEFAGRPRTTGEGAGVNLLGLPEGAVT